MLCYSPAKSRRTRFLGQPPSSGDFSHMASDFQPGSMDISQHKKTYAGFLTGSKWTFIFIMAIMVFLAIFRTH
jgi:hypothetical protein